MLSSAVCLIACSLARLPYIPFESVGRQGKGRLQDSVLGQNLFSIKAEPWLNTAFCVKSIREHKRMRESRNLHQSSESN